MSKRLWSSGVTCAKCLVVAVVIVLVVVVATAAAVCHCSVFGKLKERFLTDPWLVGETECQVDRLADGLNKTKPQEDELTTQL